MNARFAIVRRRWRAMDPIVRAMILNWIGGMGVGVVCAALMLLFDFAGLRTLLWRSDMPVAGTLMLSAGFAFTFGGLVAARGDERIRLGRRRQAARRPPLPARGATQARARAGRRRRPRPLTFSRKRV